LEALITCADAAQKHTHIAKIEPPAGGGHAASGDIRFVLETPAAKGSTGALLEPLSAALLQSERFSGPIWTNRKQSVAKPLGASRYFILTSVTVADCSVGDQLLALRRDLGWRGLLLDRPPHATYDPPHVRNEIMTNIATQSADRLRIDATILDKAKTPPRLRSDTALYSEAWRLHFQYLARC
jgi:hypothetical protein